MEEQELKNIWKNATIAPDTNLNISAMINGFKHLMETRERIVRRRDQKEIIGAILSILIFSFVGIDLSFSISTIGCGIMCVSFVYIIYKLRSNRKSKFTQGLFLSLEKQLSLQKQFMVNQVKLLNTVFYWMLLPFNIGHAIYAWGIWNMDNYDTTALTDLIYPEKISSKIIVTLFMAGYAVYIGWLNKKAAKVNWGPLIAQIDEILLGIKSQS